jgi:hypothetical protein
MMICQYFTAAPYPTRRASQLLPHFPERADARGIHGSPDRPATVCESHKFVPVRLNGKFGRAPMRTSIRPSVGCSTVMWPPHFVQYRRSFISLLFELPKEEAVIAFESR